MDRHLHGSLTSWIVTSLDRHFQGSSHSFIVSSRDHPIHASSPPEIFTSMMRSAAVKDETVNGRDDARNIPFRLLHL